MRRGGDQSGFTMIEMMIAVAVVGILAAVAVVAYTKNARKVKSTEIVMMFGELKSREELYRAEFGKYLPVCAAPTGAQWQDCGETEDAYWPSPLPGAGQVMNALTPPARWRTLRVKLPSAGMYCQYAVVAGLAGSRTNMTTRGDDLFPVADGAPTRNWFYLLGRCDWDGESSVKAEYWQRDDWSELGKENEGR